MGHERNIIGSEFSDMEVIDTKKSVKHDYKDLELDFDYGFVCLGMRANAPILDAVRKEFEDEDVEIMNIGDSVRARRIIEGTEEGRNILNVLAKHDYL